MTALYQSDQFAIWPYQRDFAAPFYQLTTENRSRLEDFFAGTIKHTTTLASTNSFFEQMQTRIREKSFYPFFLTDSKDRNKLIGLVDVKNIDWSIPKAELGFFISAAYEGQGIITKSVALVIEHLNTEHQFKKLMCRIDQSNLGSIRVAEKNGFELEGTIRRDYKTTNGRLVDLNYYGRLF